MGNLQNYVHNMWKQAAERKPDKYLAINTPTQRKPDPMVDLVEAFQKKNSFKKPSPEEIARRIWNNSRKFRNV